MTISPKLPLKHTSEQSGATILLGIREAMRLSCFAMAGALPAAAPVWKSQGVETLLFTATPDASRRPNCKLSQTLIRPH